MNKYIYIVCGCDSSTDLDNCYGAFLQKENAEKLADKLNAEPKCPWTTNDYYHVQSIKIEDWEITI